MAASPPALAPTVAHYGADEHGLVYGYVFAPGGPGQPLAGDEAAAWLRGEAPVAGGRFAWLHFNLSHAGAEPWLRAHARLGDGYFEALHQGSRTTRIEREGLALFGVFNDVTFDFAFEAGDVATLWVHATAHAVVSARRHPLRTVDRLRQAVKQGLAIDTPVALLDHLLRSQADELGRIARLAVERVDDLEDSLLAGHSVGLAAELGRLRRLAVRLQRLLAVEPNALLRVLGSPPPWVSAADVERLRQASDDFALALRDIAGMHERVKLLQDEAAARTAEQNNRSLFLLTMVTVFALPINLIAGLMGMNVGGIPLANHPHGFWWLVAVVTLFTGVAAWVGFRRMRPQR